MNKLTSIAPPTGASLGHSYFASSNNGIHQFAHQGPPPPPILATAMATTARNSSGYTRTIPRVTEFVYKPMTEEKLIELINRNKELEDELELAKIEGNINNQNKILAEMITNNEERQTYYNYYISNPAHAERNGKSVEGLKAVLKDYRETHDSLVQEKRTISQEIRAKERNAKTAKLEKEFANAKGSSRRRRASHRRQRRQTRRA